MIAVPGAVAALLRRGLVDTALQVAATVGTRFLLILAIFVLARFVGTDEIATYDLFIVATSLLLIVMTFGLDSALAIVATETDEESRHAAIWTSILMTVVLFVSLYWPLRLASQVPQLQSLLPPKVFNAAYLYAGGSALMTLVFAYFRWLGKALAASAVITVANVVGVTAGAIWFAKTGTIDGFISGLLLGSAIGTAAVLWIISRHAPLLPVLRKHGGLTALSARLANLAWPFGIASLLLIARRAVDRGILIGAGGASALGSYALVSRAGETGAFFLALPAMGVAPIILARHREAEGQHVARLLYGGYLLLSLAVVAVVVVIVRFGQGLVPPAAVAALPALAALTVGNLFFTESTVAGFGFVINGRTSAIAWLSLLFIAVMVAVAWPLSRAFGPLIGVSAGFVIAAFVHSSLFIWLSERVVTFGYPLKLIVALKLVVLGLSLYLLFA